MTNTSKVFDEPIEAVVAERYAELLDTCDLHGAQPLAAELIRSIVSERDALRAELDEAKAEIERRHNAQSYTYIGKDGKSVQARDLEDERDALKAEVERLRSFVGEFATAVFPATRNFTGPHPADEIEATTPADYVHAFQEDALALLKGSSQ